MCVVVAFPEVMEIESAILTLQMLNVPRIDTAELYAAIATLKSMMCSTSIVVKTLTGKTITIATQLSNTIDNVKEKIQVAEGFPTEVQKLIFSGKPLVSGRLLENGIGDGDVLFLMIEIPGGDKGAHGCSACCLFYPEPLPQRGGSSGRLAIRDSGADAAAH
jgi:large subunit ribosomal protein L40e